MADYKKMYIELFNRVTDIIEELQEAQRQVENIYIESQDAKIVSLDICETSTDSYKEEIKVTPGS